MLLMIFHSLSNFETGFYYMVYFELNRLISRKIRYKTLFITIFKDMAFSIELLCVTSDSY